MSVPLIVQVLLETKTWAQRFPDALCHLGLMHPEKIEETTCKYSKHQVVFKHDDHTKKFMEDVKDRAYCSASKLSGQRAHSCLQQNLENNLCSFNSFQWRTVVYNRRSLMAAFHLATCAFPHVHEWSPGFTGDNTANASLGSPCISPKQHLLKTDLEL